MRSASDPTCPRSRNSLDKALASTKYTSLFYSKESADSCYRHIYLASYEALPTLPVGIWEKCLCKLNPTCIPNAISKVSPMPIVIDLFQIGYLWRICPQAKYRNQLVDGGKSGRPSSVMLNKWTWDLISRWIWECWGTSDIVILCGD